MGKIDHDQTPTKHNNAQTVWIILGVGKEVTKKQYQLKQMELSKLVKC